MSNDQMMVIDFSPSGGVQAMHRDELDLGFLGRQEITRASDIRFGTDDQRWHIHVADGDDFVLVPLGQGFQSYNRARRFEVDWFEAARLAGFPPLSDEGKAIAYAMMEATAPH